MSSSFLLNEQYGRRFNHSHTVTGRLHTGKQNKLGLTLLLVESLSFVVTSTVTHQDLRRGFMLRAGGAVIKIPLRI